MSHSHVCVCVCEMNCEIYKFYNVRENYKSHTFIQLSQFRTYDWILSKDLLVRFPASITFWPCIFKK